MLVKFLTLSVKCLFRLDRHPEAAFEMQKTLKLAISLILNIKGISRDELKMKAYSGFEFVQFVTQVSKR